MSTSSEYTSNDIKTLSEIEHIRQNAGMYIGLTTTPNHLLYEVLDNSLDEANSLNKKILKEGNTNKSTILIYVSIDNEAGITTIADNGRGIPFENNTIPTIATKLFTGGKFNKAAEGSPYGTAIGLHGIGLVAVTALSEWVEITVIRDGKKAYYKFVDCKVAEEKIEDYKEAKKPYSTCVRFKPDAKYFESIKMDIAPVKTRLELASIHIESLSTILKVDKSDHSIIKMSMNDYFKQAFFKGQTENVSPIFDVRRKIKDEELRIMFGWDMNSYSQPICGGSINLLPVEQGTHINMTYLVLQEVFENIAKKEKLNYNLTDFKIGLRVYTSMQLYKPAYSSQTKERLSNSKASLDHLYKDMAKDIEAAIRKDEELFNKIVYFIDSYRQSLNAKKSVVKTSSSGVTRYNQSIDSKLKDCSSSDVSRCELFITEGDSASGGLVQCRNPKYHAVLGLKGKIPNLAAGKKDFLKNKEIVEIINALGTGVAPDFDINRIRYDKIIVATDADADGSHIATLFIVAMLKIIPGVLEAGKVYRAVMPLYGVRKFEGKFLPFYTEDEMKTFQQSHPRVEISRYKGLGEMMPEQLKECLINPEVRRLQRIPSSSTPEEIFKIMTDAEAKRGLITDE